MRLSPPPRSAAFTAHSALRARCQCVPPKLPPFCTHSHAHTRPAARTCAGMNECVGAQRTSPPFLGSVCTNVMPCTRIFYVWATTYKKKAHFVQIQDFFHKNMHVIKQKEFFDHKFQQSFSQCWWKSLILEGSFIQKTDLNHELGSNFLFLSDLAYKSKVCKHPKRLSDFIILA